MIQGLLDGYFYILERFCGLRHRHISLHAGEEIEFQYCFAEGNFVGLILHETFILLGLIFANISIFEKLFRVIAHLESSQITYIAWNTFCKSDDLAYMDLW